LRAIMIQHPGGTPPDNVVMFPASRCARPQDRGVSQHPASHPRSAALSGAELNARLVILLCICVSGAAALVSAAHFLHG
jgi:hypothetical protein